MATQLVLKQLPAHLAKELQMVLAWQWRRDMKKVYLTPPIRLIYLITIFGLFAQMVIYKKA